MNITFLVGNGFDMRMGLNTSYKAVEAYYTSRSKESSSIKDFQTHIQKNGEYWSNFEMGLGKYTGSITEGQSEYLDCVNDFTNELIRYLTAEESKVFLEGCEADIKKVFEFSISHFDVDVPEKYKSEIKRIMSGNEEVVFRFASFNYTHILDECLKLSFGKEKKVGEHGYSGRRHQHVVDTNVLHIHGELPGPIITGVDNRDQIDNTQWADDYRFREILVKPALNSRAGKMVDDGLKRIIQESKIICIFGKSIGESDKSWWELVGQWLYNENHRLLIFEHQDMQNRGKLTYPQQFAIENKK